MYIKLKSVKKPISGFGIEEGVADYEIGIIIGWHMPNISLRMPNRTLNSTFFDAIFILMADYTVEDLENSHRD